MYNGYVESPEQIEARKRRILSTCQTTLPQLSRFNQLKFLGYLYYLKIREQLQRLPVRWIMWQAGKHV